MILYLLINFFLTASCGHASWPEAPWLNGLKPQTGASLYAVAFGSPFDLQFIKILDVWKKLEKKYKEHGAVFLVVMHPENIFPFSETAVSETVLNKNFSLPVYLDNYGSYSKKWRAYVSPTVNLVLKNDKVISFDPGNFDPFNFEKNLQKNLKEAGINKLPPKEYATENEFRGCTHGNTYYLGSKQKSVWGKDPVNFNSGWSEKELWLERSNTPAAQIEIDTKEPLISIIAESTNNQPQQIKINGQNTVSIKSVRSYEIFAGQKITLETNSKNLKIWAVQTLPSCRNFK